MLSLVSHIMTMLEMWMEKGMCLGTSSQLATPLSIERQHFSSQWLYSLQRKSSWLAAKEWIWLKGLVSNLGFPKEKAIIFYDNQSAILLAKDQVHHERMKHIAILGFQRKSLSFSVTIRVQFY